MLMQGPDMIDPRFEGTSTFVKYVCETGLKKRVLTELLYNGLDLLHLIFLPFLPPLEQIEHQISHQISQLFQLGGI